MDWESLVAWCLIAGAGVYVLRSAYLAVRGMKTGCSGGGCGCSKTKETSPKTEPALIAPEELVLRQRPR